MAERKKPEIERRSVSEFRTLAERMIEIREKELGRPLFSTERSWLVRGAFRFALGPKRGDRLAEETLKKIEESRRPKK